MRVSDAPVSGCALAGSNQEQIAWYDLLGRDLARAPVPNDDRLLGERLRQREDRPLCRRLLPEAEDAVHDKDGEDREALTDVADGDRDVLLRQGGEQRVDELVDGETQGTGAASAASEIRSSRASRRVASSVVRPTSTSVTSVRATSLASRA